MKQEEHVRICLDGDKDHAPQTVKYLIYQLRGESRLIGIECKTADYSHVKFCTFLFFSGIICFEEFVEGSMVARLSCLCSFHQGKRHVQQWCVADLILCCSMLVLLASTW